MKWLTVQQVAEYLQLSPMMVYKLAQGAKIPAAKIGRVWRFDQAAIDRWLEEKSVPARELPFKTQAKEAVEDFVRELKKEFGKQLSQVLIFGSYARGEATPESDVDVLVVLKEPFDYRKTRDHIRKMDYAVTFGRDRPVVISSVLMGEKEFLEGDSFLLLNVREEAKRAA
ncbi:MAG: helix-turn-helix domain-containing protein [Deltaproteobacteria bacterium]|nr:helix-turn-helix domain-containing protein [Deltaproteobacteria bacterium]